MSTLALATDFKSNISLEDLRTIAAKFNITIPPGPDEEAYLLLLQSAEALHNAIEESPDYIHPSLFPVPTTEPRTFWKPSTAANPLNAWSHACELTALNPTSSLLQGRTVVLKDNISVAGLPTTLGIPPFLHSQTDTHQPSPIDATIVSRLLNAGATIKGTAVCESYSAAPVSFTSASGPVHNPWAPSFTAGGSSSGCAALIGQKARTEHIAANPDGKNGVYPDIRTVELAVGGDQGGSIRLPASYTGIYGLKATHGLIPYTGAATISPMIDHLGPMASTLDDIAIMLQIMAGYDGIDARMTPESPLPNQVKDYPALLRGYRSSLPLPANTEGKKLRIGLLKESFSFPNTTPLVRETVYNTAKAAFIAAGATVTEISIPMHTLAPQIWTAATRNTLSTWAIEGHPPGYLTYNPPHINLRWPPDQAMFDEMTRLNPTIMNLVFGTEYFRDMGNGVEFKGQRKVFELRGAYDAAFEEVDVLVTPTVPGVAFPFPDLEGGVMERARVAVGLSVNTCGFNVTGHPAMNVPCGFGEYEKDGGEKVRLPVGMQVVGRRWEDEMLLRAAAAFEWGSMNKPE